MNRSDLIPTLSLFSGAGGLDLGVESTGYFQTKACIDYDEDCIETLRKNQEIGKQTGCHNFLTKARILRRDLSTASAKELLREVGMTKGIGNALVYGGPPCQSFSTMGKRQGIADDRGDLVHAFADLVIDMKPKAFIFENVTGFFNIQNGEVASKLTSQFRDAGYGIWAGILRAADFGDPTSRARFFILGVANRPDFVGPLPTHRNIAGDQSSFPDFGIHSSRPYVSCWEVLKDLPPPGSPGAPSNHTAVDHRDESIARFRNLEFGETDKARRRKRLDPGRPAFTLYVGGSRGKLQARSHIHPYAPREITPRESARIHGFPDVWEFAGRSDSVLQQVANSVPVHLGAAVARCVYEAGWRST